MRADELEAVIFSMTIPRRQKWEVPDWFFVFEIRLSSKWPKAFLSLIIAGIIVIFDTAVWVFTIFACAGPMLVGGLHEAFIDYKILGHIDDHSHNPADDVDNDNVARTLSNSEKAELLLTMVSGNLDRSINDPQNVLNSIVIFPERSPTPENETPEQHDERVDKRKKQIRTTSTRCSNGR